MSKGLKALQEIKSKPFSWEKLKDNLDTIEKELKALKIIKNKQVYIRILKQNDNFNDYNWAMALIYRNEHSSRYYLTEEEFDLLKEVLL